MKILLFITFLMFKTAFAQPIEIKLPPDPGSENDKTLHGIDSNKNNVRDDVEIHIWENISKDPKTYLALIKVAETKLEMLKHSRDLEKLKFYDLQQSNDMFCLSAVEKKDIGNKWISPFMRKILNTDERKKENKEIIKRFNDFSNTVKSPTHEQRLKLCRF